MGRRIGLLVGSLAILALASCFHVTNTPPVAKLSVTPKTGPAPLQVTSDASGSMDAEGNRLSFAWAFGDGDSVPVLPWIQVSVTTPPPVSQSGMGGCHRRSTLSWYSLPCGSVNDAETST